MVAPNSMDLNQLMDSLKNQSKSGSAPAVDNILGTSPKPKRKPLVPVHNDTAVDTTPKNATVVDDGANLEDDDKVLDSAVELVSNLVEISDDGLKLRGDVSFSSGGKIPSALWNAAKDTWGHNLQYKNSQALTNNVLILGLLIRSLDISDEQRNNLIDAFPRKNVIRDIVNYQRENPNDKLTASLENIEKTLDQMKQDNDANSKWLKRSIAGMKRALGWLFLERIGLTVGYVSESTPVKDAAAYLKSDAVTLSAAELDTLGDDVLQTERTYKNKKI